MTDQLLKWAGSKLSSLRSYQRLWPEKFGRLVEPFAGSCAVYAWMRRERGSIAGLLSDANGELINLLTVCRDRPSDLIARLTSGRYENSQFNYYEVRYLSPTSLSKIERAARTLFLNRAGFNGLYRVNGWGHFNVPHGDGRWSPENSIDSILEWSDILSGARIKQQDFEDAIDEAEEGDLVYADPPFLDQFVGYTAQRFGWGDYQRLREAVYRADRRGALVMVSCPDDMRLVDLFSNMRLDKHAVERKIGGRRTSRQQTFELTFRNYSVGDEA